MLTIVGKSNKHALTIKIPGQRWRSTCHAFNVKLQKYVVAFQFALAVNELSTLQIVIVYSCKKPVYGLLMVLLQAY